MKKKARIGILGGTFNPPHLGHLILAEAALDQLNLDKVIFIPTFIPPHKKVRDNNARIRYKMVALACEGNPGFKASEIELNRKSVSYSVDTLRRLRSDYGKNAKLFFLIGSDSLEELRSWKDVDKVLELATFIVANRPNAPAKKRRWKIRQINMPAVEISASMIRDRVRHRHSIRYLVTEDIRKFIIRNKLYRS